MATKTASALVEEVRHTTLDVVEEVAEKAHNAQSHTLAAASKLVVAIHELPQWMQKDKYIKHGFRRQQHGFRGCFDSLWYIHNETINIWSHLLTMMFMCGLLAWTVTPSLHSHYNFATVDLRVLQFYLLANIGTLGFSAFYHCVSCHSQHVATCCLKLDYLGIVLGITSTAVSSVYFALYTSPHLVQSYMRITIFLGALTFWLVLDPRMDGERAAAVRAGTFLLLGLSGYVPFAHGIAGPDLDLSKFPIEILGVNTALWLAGAAFYVSRTPERQFPGVFDIWGSSHQIFHVLINVSQVLHLWLLRTMLLQHSGFVA